MTAREVIVVSKGLDLRGGGSAVVARLVVAAAAPYCAERGLGLRAFTLGGPCEVPAPATVRHFAGDHLGLARAIWASQIPHSRARLLFDHLGPARSQAVVPGALRSRYALFLLGWEVWRELTWDRRRAIQGAAVRLAISTFTRDRAREFFPRLGTTDVLPLALEQRLPAGDVDRELVGRLGRDFLLIVARMVADERYKGHDQLLAALPKVHAACPGARLVVVGDGDDRLRLARAVATQGLAAYVQFAGFVSEATLRELYDRSAALVLPSPNEGFGLVYLEAMRAGKPCLALRGSAAAEIVEDEVTGLLIDYGNEDQLVSALMRLVSDAEMRSRLGEAGRERWATKFTFDVFRDGLRPHLDRLLGPDSEHVRD